MSYIRRYAAKNHLRRIFNRFSTPVLGGQFSSKARQRLLIYHYPNSISWSLVYPYFHYADTFWRDYGLDIRTLPVEAFLSGEASPEADIVLVQPWLMEKGSSITEAIARYRERHPRARIIFLDSFAHVDLRFGREVASQIDLYQRKALFRDRRMFLGPRAGDTNLVEYYSMLYGLPAKMVDWHVPPDLLDRLSLVPNFLTAPYLMQGFLGPAPNFTHRPIDLHSRISLDGGRWGWYEAMRSHADRAARAMKGIVLTSTGRIPQRDFMDEMHRSKLCWSPFGYGELCWRDIEAFMSGAMLIKPDMSHLETQPDLYVAGETYLPVRWDYSDLEEVVREALSDPGRYRYIATNAFNICRDYLMTNQFVVNSILDFGIL